MEQKNQEQNQKQKTSGKEAAVQPQGKLVVVRIRGITGIKTKITSTLNMLRLYKNNYCVVVPNTPLYIGMLKRAKDYITWGELDDETFRILVEKRGEEFKGRETDSKSKIKYNEFMQINSKKIKKYFRLSPPRKGFERKGVKTPYSMGGAIGYRGSAINDLVKRMI